MAYQFFEIIIKKCLLSDGSKISLNQKSFALWDAISLASEQDIQSIFWGKTKLEDLSKDKSLIFLDILLGGANPKN